MNILVCFKFVTELKNIYSKILENISYNVTMTTFSLHSLCKQLQWAWGQFPNSFYFTQ